jgi:hypothetical protein
MKASKLRDSLIEQADMARLSRVLVALKEDAPALPLEDFKLGAIPPSLWRLSGEHGFTSLLKRLDAGRGSPERATQLNPAKAAMTSAVSAEAPRTPPPCPPSMWTYDCVTTRGAGRWIARCLPPAWWRLTPKPALWMRSGPIWWGSACPSGRVRPATSRWAMAARHVRRKAGTDRP